MENNTILELLKFLSAPYRGCTDFEILQIAMAMLTRTLGMSSEEVELLLVDLRQEIKDKSIHSYFPV